MPTFRLGDDIDDYCVRCKRVMNHSVVSVVNAEPAKVRCRICHSDHDYRHEVVPPSKAELKKQALLAEGLAAVDPEAALPPDPIEPEETPEAPVASEPPEPAPKAKPKKTARK